MNCKHLIVIPDGAADRPIEQFGGKTVLQAADIPNIDRLSQSGIQGLVQTVPQGMSPGSDVAQMSLLGYNPHEFYTGRAPIEAAAMGIDLSQEDFVFRCNLVTYSDGNMADHSAGHISTNEGRQIIEELQKQLGSEKVRFYPGVSYRHLCVVSGMDFDIKALPPHDNIGRPVRKILPSGKNSAFLKDLMEKSRLVIEQMEINKIRTDLGENPVSSIWLWGEGKRASMESFKAKYGLKGASITAVDLVRGLSKLIGFEIIEVEGATGLPDTNYEGKAEAAAEALDENDIVFLHLEGPDEAGHSGDAELKRTALERIDSRIIAPLSEKLEGYDEWKILVMPDHPTPVSTRGHTAEPVPFMISGTVERPDVQGRPFSESNAARSGLHIERGYELMEYFLKV
ncbi:cofactor-independent phosphoglycerate mutase [Sedimentisphaera salicampi]|uniref:Cofactor-independent phosphoglycerate mutase n=1 Tax=Sedimentisphaera salicampi TaxID=1941349 RepID=A0A1W6LN34_9BACT|nr:cofactor-independent phosphoglycerate mutase [Sedimentisphaera salicampi]ARN57195.1 cofactor-independent phosphoglycerate mutase [Sedimentisphaera salicampi]OXU14748.1 cofactor-independent phosphoglycerate mutase [Sedimentisphaera salicampi]